MCGTVLALLSRGRQVGGAGWKSFFKTFPPSTQARQKLTKFRKNMTETKMPAAEAVEAGERELASYELAFHVLPTVAEGEVANVFQKLQGIITKHGGNITTEESPVRFDLAYEIIKYLEGRNRKFTSAYFGWIRFTIEADKLHKVIEAVEGTKELLRHLLIRLTKTEEAHPFFIHDVIESLKQVQNIEIDDEEVVADEETDDVEAVAEVVDTEDGEEDADKV